MTDSRSFLSQIRRLFRLADAPAWAGPVIVALGLTAAVLEGLALFLFIPLLQSMGATAPVRSASEQFFEQFVLSIPSHWATAYFVGLLGLCIVLKSAVNFLNSWISRYVDGLVAHRLRARVFEQTISSCADYRMAFKRTDIVTTIANNTWKVSHGLSIAYRTMVCSCTFATFLVLMLLISVRLTLFAMACLAVSVLVVRAATRCADRTGKAVVEENKRFGLRMWESINSMQLIRLFANESYELDRFRHISERVRQRLLKLDLLWAVPPPVSEISVTIVIGVLVLAAGWSGVGIAALAAFLSIIYRLQGPTRELLQSKLALDGIAGAIDDVDGYLRETSQPFLKAGNLAAAPVGEAVEFRNVSFRYSPGEPWALRNASFLLPAGKTTAIVGESGAGKSTIMALLFRFYDPTFGEITADGTRLAEFDLASWRSQLALMSQDVHLFNDTVEANIGYGDLRCGPSDIVNAAVVADADSFISRLPRGYATLVGDDGMRLSGGQRQRVALARTVLRNPDILLLDEATSSLDVESERAFQAALETYATKRTIVIIAHRLSTVQKADQIIVLARGKVVEAGPPSQLLSRPSHFARLYNLQLGRPALAAT